MRGIHAPAALVAAILAVTFVGGASGEPGRHKKSSSTVSIDKPAGVIAFYSEGDGDAEIWVMNADGSHRTQLTDNDVNDICPAWSPDGSRIAFESDRDDPNPVKCFPDCVSKIYVMNADGSGAKRLFDLPTSEGHPSWSPDGSQIAFESDRDGDGKVAIWIANADGTDPRQLTDDERDAHAADWSPDGKTIAFTMERDVYVVNADGSGLRRVVDTGMDDYFPDWSPDGKRIAFFALRPRESRQDIYLVNADGTGLVKLTDSATVVNEDPAWSPDGEWIAFQSDRDRNFEIYIMRADGSDARNVTRSGAPDYWPDWRPTRD